MRFSILALAIFAAACQTEEPRKDTIQDQTAIGLSQADENCASQGGQLIQGGHGQLVCQRPTIDAGKSCASSQDCEGQCLAQGQVCTPMMPYFGCFETYENGVTPTICVD